MPLHATQFDNREICPAEQAFFNFLLERFGVANDIEWEYLVITGQVSTDAIWEYRLVFFSEEVVPVRRGEDACCWFPNHANSRTINIPLINNQHTMGWVRFCSNCIAVFRAFNMEGADITHLLRPGTPWWQILGGGLFR